MHMGMAKLGPLDPFVVATGLTLYTPITIRVVLVYCTISILPAQFA